MGMAARTQGQQHAKLARKHSNQLHQWTGLSKSSAGQSVNDSLLIITSAIPILRNILGHVGALVFPLSFLNPYYEERPDVATYMIMRKGVEG